MNYPISNIKKTILVFIFLFTSACLRAEDGYDLWLRYKTINNRTLLTNYRNTISAINIITDSPILIAAKEELEKGLKGLLEKMIPVKSSLQNGVILAGTASRSSVISQVISKENLASAGKEGFIIRSVNHQGKKMIVITANNDIGVLYGCFHFLRLLQTQQPVSELKIISSPSLQLRLLNHWDNLDRYVERGYAGISIWN